MAVLLVMWSISAKRVRRETDAITLSTTSSGSRKGKATFRNDDPRTRAVRSIDQGIVAGVVVVVSSEQLISRRSFTERNTALMPVVALVTNTRSRGWAPTNPATIARGLPTALHISAKGIAPARLPFRTGTWLAVQGPGLGTRQMSRGSGTPNGEPVSSNGAISRGEGNTCEPAAPGQVKQFCGKENASLRWKYFCCLPHFL